MPTSGSGSADSFVTSGSQARRNLQNYRRLLAKKLNSLSLVTTTSAGNASGTSLIASGLAGGLDSNRYRGTWVLITGGTLAGQLRRVGDAALNTSTGELSIATAFSAQVPTDVDVAIHRMLPPEDHDGYTGLRSCINAALAECWTTARLAITGVANQPSYDLAGYADWLEPEAVRELWGESITASDNPLPNGGILPYRDAGELTVEVEPALGAGDTAELEVFRPLDTWIKVGGTWGNSTLGLVNDSDEALINPDFLVQVALVHAYEALAVGNDSDRWEKKAKDQRVKANFLKLNLLNHQQRRLGGHTTGYRAYGVKDFRSW